MPKRKRPAALPDANQTAAALVRKVTGTDKEDGESLLGSPALREALREAKAKDKARSITRIKRAKVATTK